jgi:hypothetical protein
MKLANFWNKKVVMGVAGDGVFLFLLRLFLILFENRPFWGLSIGC